MFIFYFVCFVHQLTIYNKFRNNNYYSLVSCINEIYERRFEPIETTKISEKN